MHTRRTFIKLAGGLMLSPLQSAWASPSKSNSVLVNDIHSQLNPTNVEDVVSTKSLNSVVDIINKANNAKDPIAICGGRHAMGGQQFATNSLLIDTSDLTKILAFDQERGTIEVESGIQWPELISYLARQQKDLEKQWCVIQKQTGTDTLSLGGALSANAHGRGLKLKPMVGDIESFSLVTANGELLKVSREEHPDLFRLAVGGYGLFGFVYSVNLRLRRRVILKRTVTVAESKNVISNFQKRINEGAVYGDFQFAIDKDSEKFLQEGILSTYSPLPLDTPIPKDQKVLSLEDWKELVILAHTDPTKAFQKYSDHYLSTNGQLYWSDTNQLSTYLAKYHQWLDKKLKAKHPATEIISEIYVPRKDLAEFLTKAADVIRKHSVSVIYGTIRLIEKDDETFLAWAKQDYACIIFNLHTEHTTDGVNVVADAFRGLIDLAISYGGSYYLTYHKFATKQELLACYPQFPEFLKLKLEHDPNELFQSDWYRHYKQLLG